MTTSHVFYSTLALTALMTLTIPALAQPAPKPLTPPVVLGAAKTIQFTATLMREGQPVEVSVACLERPNMAFIQDTDAKTKTLDNVYALDGKTQIEYRASHGHYTKSTAPATFEESDTHATALNWLGVALNSQAFAEYHHVPNAPFSRYETSPQLQDGKLIKERLTVDTGTGLPQDMAVLQRAANSAEAVYEVVEHVQFSHWRLNAPIDESKFAYTPPASATLYSPPKLLADGAQAPEFTANDKDGKPIKLSDYRGKIVVLDFWATWCGPCQISLPHTTAIAKQYAGKDVTVLAVNVWDKPQAFQAWLPKHPEYAALHFAIDPAQVQDKGIATGLYGVSGIPTQYVIGKDGRIVRSIVGYEEGGTALEDALKAAGVE